MKKAIFLLFLIPLFTSAQVKTHWKDARFLSSPVENIMVFSQFNNSELRAEVEEAMVSALEAKGISAVGASAVFNYDSLYLYSTMERKFDSVGADGIMIIKMLEERSADMYIQPEELIPPC